MVSLEPDRKTGEIAFIVSDPWQKLGLGTKMVDYALEICKDMKVEKLYAVMLPENYRAISLMKKMGFRITYLNDGTVKGTLDLKQEDEAYVCPTKEPKETDEQKGELGDHSQNPQETQMDRLEEVAG